MDDTWWTRDLPVLDVAVRLLEHHDLPEVTDIPRETGPCSRGCGGAYVDVPKTMGDVEGWFVKTVTPQARCAVGQWPTPESVVDRLAEAFGAAAERDPERRGKLRALANFLGEAGRDFAAEVVAK